MINCIVAVDRNQGIGLNGQMPWPHLSGDMRWFKEKTVGQVVVMGRKTWESIGSRALPNRENIVLSRNYVPSASRQFSFADEALDFCKLYYPNREIFIIGGGAIYEIYKHIVDRFYVTEIDADYGCDTFFDYTYVKENFTKVTEHATFTDPVKYTIKEYNP